MLLPIPHNFTSVVTDSREIKEGSLFIAIHGNRCDGHTFLKQVKEKGAVAALVSKKYNGESFGLKLYTAEDTVMALQDWAKEYYKYYNPKTVAITGSVGKTSTKEYLSKILSTKYEVAKTPGNFNSKIGVPLTILNTLNGASEVLVLEMGMSEKGDLKNLVKIAPPDIAILTAVAYAHAENFISLDEIVLAKAEIFSHEKTKYGLLPKDLKAKLSSVGSCIKIPFEEYSSQLPKHHHSNLGAAVQAAKLLGLTDEEIKNVVPQLTLPPKRMQQVMKEGTLWINDSYNASPLSMKGALETLKFCKGRKVAVLGEMRELGIFSFEEHQLIGEYAIDCADLLFTLGEETKPLYQTWKDKGRDAHYSNDLSELKSLLKTSVRKGDVVLVKGSNSLKMWELL